MMSSTGSAPAWLFAFVDLAFLLLLGLTQLGDGRSPALDLGELQVPRIEREPSAVLPTSDTRAWQLRVHVEDGQARPFELVDPERARPDPERVRSDTEANARLDALALATELEQLRGRGEREPLIAPHADSRSEDLLAAVAAVDSNWGGRRRALVSPGGVR